MAKEHQIWDTTCVNCRQAITNPVCPECMENEIVAWAVSEKKGMIPSIRELIYKNVTKDNANTHCIICNKRMELCTYCIKQDVLDFLNMHYPELVESFKKHFGI